MKPTARVRIAAHEEVRRTPVDSKTKPGTPSAAVCLHKAVDQRVERVIQGLLIHVEWNDLRPDIAHREVLREQAARSVQPEGFAGYGG